MRILNIGCLLSLIVAPALGASDTRPNVVVLLADDQGWGDLGRNGNRNLRTPHVDSLARDGARFGHFFVQPVCSPTRAEFLTGRYHPRGGVSGVSTGEERLDLDERTIAEAFRDAGYATGAFGKWHNGSQYPYHPRGRGFQEYYGFTSGHWGDYFDPPLDHNGVSVRGQGYFADDITTHAIDFLTQSARAGRPFFCYVTFNTPHSPMQVPDPYWNRFEKAELTLLGNGTPRENLMHTRAALAMCENIDDNVGRILAALRDQKLDSDTVVVYFSDNGPNGPRWNDGLKGRKGSTDEGGVRSPLHIRWPRKIAPGTAPTLNAAAIDLLPTLLALTGVERAPGQPLDGLALAPWLLGQANEPPNRILFQHWAGKVSARSQRFRLDAGGQLFDMEGDPGQQRDVRAEHPAVARELTEAVERWRREVLSLAVTPDIRPFPVGYAEFPRAVLPARDGVPRGAVRRSAPAPNCSYFTDWTTTDDRMTWQIHVATPGRYEAILHYTCPADEVGSTVELGLNDAAWSGTIREAHDPPLRGQERDRVPRVGESYQKDFRPLALGVVELPQGPGVLTLRATHVAGRHVADVRAVELVRQP